MISGGLYVEFVVPEPKFDGTDGNFGVSTSVASNKP